jgi:CheY-like chemotaxis protein/predicted regulator of Ras-like GTPase activity (Roadblock/LC7/MglB family)
MTARRRILIVDDETKVAFFLQESLEALGHNFEVVSVSSTKEALREINRKRFNLLVTDQRMPDMEGLELIEQVQKRYPETQFILITAYGSEDVLAKAQRLGAYRFFTKPFHIEDFVQTVLEALQEKANSQPRESLSNQHVDVLSSRLEELRREVGAQCVLASTSSGTLVTQVGVLSGLDAGQLLQLAAEGFAASSAMTQYLGGNHTSNLNYHEGAKYDIYTSSVHDDLFLVIIFDRRVQASRIGIVWLYARRAIESLRRVMTSSIINGNATRSKRTHSKDTRETKALKGELVPVDQVMR